VLKAHPTKILDGRGGFPDLAQFWGRGYKRCAMRTSFVVISLLLAGGCARYEFDLVEPADLPNAHWRDKETIIQAAMSWSIGFQAVDSRLLMYVVNSTD